MSRKRYLLGIDAGTTSVKAILATAEGKIVGAAAREYNLEYPAPNFCEVDAELYWRSACHVVKSVLRTSGITPSTVVGLAISSQGETLIPVDKAGRPLRKAIVWLDNRSSVEAQTIKNRFQTETLQKTGLAEIVPMWPATRILWLQKNEPDVFRHTDKYHLVEDYLIRRLTGRCVSNESMVSSTLYYDIIEKKWWPDMLDFLGILPAQLPDVVCSGTAIGSLHKEAAQALGLSDKVVVAAGAYDHAAGAIGCGNIDEGTVSETIGASMAMVATLNRPLLDAHCPLPCQCHAVPGKYFILPYGQTAGLVLKWFKDSMAKTEIHRAKSLRMDVYHYLDALAGRVPAGCDGLVALPHLMGAGSPEFNEKAKGVFCGVTPFMSKGHFVRAILESVACMIRNNLQVLTRAGVQVAEIRALGGGARSDLWNQINADCTGIPFMTFRSEEPACLGAAILAGVGCGVFADIKEGCDAMVHSRRLYQPEVKMSPAYDKVFARYLKLYQALESYWE